MLRSRWASLVREHKRPIASWTALALAAAGLVTYAVTADGQTVHRAELNDGGVWVTNQALGVIARQNTDIDQIDANVGAARGSDFDVLQDGAAVISVDLSSKTMTPVSSSLGLAMTDDQVTPAGPAVLAGGSVAVVDSTSGSLWAARVDTTRGVSTLAQLDHESTPMTNVGREAAVVATRTGSVLAVSAAESRLTTIPVSGGTFSKPRQSELSKKPQQGVVGMTAVRDAAVLLDGGGEVIVPGGSVHVVDGPAQAVLQQPGDGFAAGGDVLVATDGRLLAVALDDAKIRELAAVPGKPVAPVTVGGCIYAVWVQGAQGHFLRICDGASDRKVRDFAVSPNAVLTFRVNRNTVVLNDVRNGPIWRVDGAQPAEVSDWKSLQASKQTPKSDKNDDRQSPEVKRKPDAKDDRLGAKPGRTTVLHVLDNDLVSGGGVLSIEGVRGLEDEPAASIQLAPDRQSLLLALGRTARGNLSFTYTISDGSGGRGGIDDGQVEITVRDALGSAAPRLRENLPDAPTEYPVSAGGSLEVSVLDGWRDPDFGDPVSLDSVPPAQGFEVSVTPDGLLRLRAPTSRFGTLRVPYFVSTGGRPTQGMLLVNVLAPDGAKKTVAPQTAADVASGEIVSSDLGAVVKVRPLDNDIPGADVTDPSARLELAGKVQPTGGLKIDTDLVTGVVTVRARRPGTYKLAYTAGFGAAARDTNEIRVVIDPPSAESNLPLAAPDTTTVRGTAPVLVDVLANDYDAKGRLLAVQHAQATSEQGALEVAVIDGRWLRISATTNQLTPVTQPIEYTVSNGDAEAKGTVTVTQKAPLPSEQNVPLAEDDEVVVRVGDTALVPVLDNDSTPAGDPIGLRVPQTVKPLGSLQVEPPLGHAYVVGRNVRYVAPSSGEIAGPTTVEVQYVVENVADPARPSSAGVLRVQLNPEESETNPNRPPTPRSIEGRVVEGDAISLKLPLIGNDPDGDSVSVVGITSSPQHGRILSLAANNLMYQAFPGSSGTDEFTYEVTDKYGSRAAGDIRVAVTPAGSPQAPVAIDDAVTADLDREIEVDVLANDLRTAGTQVKLLPLSNAPEGVSLVSDVGPIRLTSSDEPRTPVVVVYAVTNGLEESKGELVVRSRKDFNNPPLVPDAYAQPTGDSATVDVPVLDKAYDIDGAGAPLQVDLPVGLTGASVRAGTVTVQVTDLAQVIPFRVSDTGGAATAAVIYVPARPKGAPYLKQGATIRIKPGASLDQRLADLVEDPEGDAVVLTLEDYLRAAPVDRLTASAPDKADVIKLTAGSVPGPGSVTFQVSDRADLTAPDANKAFLTVPVQIGEPDPIINCPAEPLTVIEGGASKVVDIASICHVWTPVPADARTLKYEAAWLSGKRAADVEVRNTDEGVQLKAGVNAVRDSVGALAVKAKGSQATGSLMVRVVAADPPRLRAMTLETEADKAVSVDVADYAYSPFGSAAKWKLVDVTQLGALDKVTYKEQGTTLIFTPATFGTYTFRATLSDDGGAAGSQRPTASAIITMSVVSEPEAPTNLRWDGVKRNGEVRLRWNAPEANGGTIEQYTVSVGGGANTVCPSTNCSVKGLTNRSQPYTFRVTAKNQYGESEASAEARGWADRVPDVVTKLTVSLQRNKSVQLKWAPPATASQHSPIQNYFVSWPGGGVRDVKGAKTYTANLFDNGTPTKFSVWAKNAAGPSSAKATVTGMGADRPAPPTGVRAAPADAAGRTQSAVVVSWDAMPANGPDPVTYLVTRAPAVPGREFVCDWQQAINCADTVTNDGTKYVYSVRARNGEATAPRETSPDLHVSASASSPEIVAAARPDEVQFESFTPTGSNGQVRAVYNVGKANGAANNIECDPRCGTMNPTTVGTGGGQVAAVIDGFSNGQPSSVRIRTCNGSSDADSCSAWVESPSATPYGPIEIVQLTAEDNDATVITWSFVVDPNGRSVHVTLTAEDFSQSWDTGVGLLDKSGSLDVGYGQKRNFTLTVTDNGTPARGSRSRQATAETPPPPPPPTISGFDAVPGGCCGGTRQVGVSWITTYAPGTSGGFCHWTRDGAEFTNELSCGANGKASRQFYDQPTGWHKYCGYIRMPDGRNSNVLCETINVS